MFIQHFHKPGSPIKWLSDFFSLILPKCCVVCGVDLLKGEEYLCLNCLNELPYTGYAFGKGNPVSRLFEGRADINSAMALLHFEKGNATQRILHQLKYRNNPGIGVYFGKMLGKQIRLSEGFSKLDAVIPVPLHPSKRAQRGYNQSEFIAAGIAEELQVPYITDLIRRVKKSSSQTRKGRYDRWQNVADIFELNPKREINFKHILITDDVVTTGSTVEACVSTIRKNPDIEVSISAIGRSA